MIDRREDHINLIDDDQFWDGVYDQYLSKDLCLPVECSQYAVRDVADSIVCPPDCGYCCKHYKRVQVTDRDVDRLLEHTGINITQATYMHGECTYLNIQGGCMFLSDNSCTVYKHRPDACYFMPIQWMYNYDTEGKQINKNLYIRIECKQAVQAIRSIFRSLLKYNPELQLLPTLAVVKHG